MVRQLARSAHPFVVAAFIACAVIQVFLAGLGVFDNPSAFITHSEFGYTFGWLTLVILILALVGRMPRRIVGLSALILVLFAFQSIFVALRQDMPQVAALHPLNGFAILFVSYLALRASWALRRDGARAAATASPLVPADVPR
jgi:hypothetical protein